MTNIPEMPDLDAIASEARAELAVAQSFDVLAVDGDADAAGFTELGYYEAELRSLRDAATALEEAEPR